MTSAAVLRLGGGGGWGRVDNSGGVDGGNGSSEGGQQYGRGDGSDHVSGVHGDDGGDGGSGGGAGGIGSLLTGVVEPQQDGGYVVESDRGGAGWCFGNVA